MGTYIKPDPEEFLAEHGTEFRTEAVFEKAARYELNDPHADRLPVVMADNGDFRAAVIIMDEREFNRVMLTVDDRRWRFFFVSKDKLKPFLN